MTPKEQATKDVEGWWNKHATADGTYITAGRSDLDDLIALLTPVYELAQQMDRLHAAVNRRELLLKLPLDEREAEIVRGGVDFICSSTLGDDPPCASCDALRERAERAEAERDAAYGFRETHWHAAHGGCAVEGCACGQCDNFRRAANKLAAAEADVARLRRALMPLAVFSDDAANLFGLNVVVVRAAREAIAATERKGEPCGQPDTSGLTGFRCGESVGHSGPHAPRPSTDPKP